MLNRKRPETITTDLTIKGLGETFSVSVEYKNLTQEQWDELMEKKKPSGEPYTLADFLERSVVKFNETEKPKAKDFEKMESEWPGMLFAIMQGFRQARVVTLEKN